MTDDAYRAAVPPLTRTIRLQLHGNRRSGTFLNTYFDDIRATLLVYNAEERRGGNSLSELGSAPQPITPASGVAGSGTTIIAGT